MLSDLLKMVILSSFGPVAILKCQVLDGLARTCLTDLFVPFAINSNRSNYMQQQNFMSFQNVLFILLCCFHCFSVVLLLHFVTKLGPKQQLNLVKMNSNYMDGSVAKVLSQILSV